MSTRSLIERVASIDLSTVRDSFQRHAALGRDAFAGGDGGRWGRHFPVIYLGRPVASVAAEAYRHLVDDAGVPANLVRARTLYTVRVDTTRVLDLTAPDALRTVGLRDDDLRTAVGDYAACQDVASAAHQLKAHGILAPSASGLGITLALFAERLPAREMPTVVTQEIWENLPNDPRRLRRVEEA